MKFWERPKISKCEINFYVSKFAKSAGVFDMARRRGGRRVFYGDFDGLDRYADRINELNGDLKQIVSDALEQAADDPTADTIEGVKKKNLPAKGQFSSGETAETVIKSPRVTWAGTVGTIGIGFDKTKNGVGTLLITGTPRMKPARKLEKIYTRKKTVKEFHAAVNEALQNAVEELEG